LQSYTRTFVDLLIVSLDSHWLEEYDAESVAKNVNISAKQLYNLSIKEAFAACGEVCRGNAYGVS